jgi:hypothetical protein
MEGEALGATSKDSSSRSEERFGYEGDHAVETTRQIAAEVRTAVRDFKNRLF